MAVQAATTVNGYVDPLRGIYTGIVTAGQNILDDATKVQDRLNFTSEIIFVTAIQDNETLALGIPGIVAVFFAVDEGQTTADPTSAHLDDAAGTIRFKVEGSATSSGWLLIFIDPVIGRNRGYPGR